MATEIHLDQVVSWNQISMYGVVPSSCGGRLGQHFEVPMYVSTDPDAYLGR
jgi:hypothetical protein